MADHPPKKDTTKFGTFKGTPNNSPGWSPVFKDVARALGFAPIVDRKRKNDKAIKEGSK